MSNPGKKLVEFLELHGIHVREIPGANPSHVCMNIDLVYRNLYAFYNHIDGPKM